MSLANDPPALPPPSLLRSLHIVRLGCLLVCMALLSAILVVGMLAGFAAGLSVGQSANLPAGLSAGKLAGLFASQSSGLLIVVSLSLPTSLSACRFIRLFSCLLVSWPRSPVGLNCLSGSSVSSRCFPLSYVVLRGLPLPFYDHCYLPSPLRSAAAFYGRPCPFKVSP